MSLAVALPVSIGHLRGVFEDGFAGRGSRLGLDYWAFLTAGDVVRSGVDGVLYTKEFLELTPTPFVYPPWAAAAMVPWTLPPATLGFVVWTLVGVAVFALALRSCGVTDWRFHAVVLVSFPSVFALGLGQSTFLQAGIVGFAVAAMAGNRITESGIWLAAASWKPHLLGGFPLIWLARPLEWMSQLRSFLLALLVLVAGSAFLLPGAWGDWIALAAGNSGSLSYAPVGVSLESFLSLATGQRSFGQWYIVIPVTVLVVGGALVLLRQTSAQLHARLALAFAVGLLIAPHVLVYDVVVLAVPLGLALGSEMRRDVVVVGMLLVVGLAVGPLLTELQLDQWGRAVNLSTLVLVVATALFAFWVRSANPFFHAEVPRVANEGGPARPVDS